MAKRGSAVDDVLTANQFGDLLATAAAIQDRQKSIECFAFLLLMGRYGLRAGEMIHANPNWEDPELPGLRIPSYDDCTCTYCQNRAEQRLEDGEDDDEAKAFDELLEEYWSPKSSNGARPIPFETERVQDIFERYFDRWGFVDVSYTTVYRRVVKVAEYTESVDPADLTPQVLRATAATFWAGRGAAPSALQRLMGWHDPSVSTYYVKVAGMQVKRVMLRARGREPDESPLPTEMYPPTWEEMRPENETDYIEIERWDLREQSPPEHPRKSEEQMLKDTVLDEFGDVSGGEESGGPGVLSATPTGTAVSLAVQGGSGLQRRARAEERAMAENPELADPTLTHAATVATAAVVPALALVTAVALGDGSTAAAGMLLGTGYGVYDIDLEE